MKRICVVVPAIFVLFAFSLVGAVLASAATLQWLASGKPITEALSAEFVGEITLGDNGIPAAVLCSATLMGTVGPGSEDLITSILNLARTEEITLTKPLLCSSVKTCEGESEVAFVNLPWLTRLELMGTEANPLFLDVYENGGNGTPGWEIVCQTFLGNVTDTCTATTSVDLVNDTTENDVLGFHEKEVISNCSIGGPNSGFIETGVTDETLLINLVNGEPLSVSYE